jgi:hypothetical protein
VNSANPVLLVLVAITLNFATAQGLEDWGMWFGTIILIGGAALLVTLLIALIRWLRR